MRRFLVPLFSCALVAAALADASGPRASSPRGTAATALAGLGAGGELAPVRVRHYRMAGRVRPLLFWFGRDDVGLARVTWRAGEDGARGYDLLVGTDPARAPRALNRWGFIAERTDVHGGALLALMTRADEDSYDEASAAAASAHDFRAIRGRVDAGVARWQVSHVRATAPLTVHDLDAALTRVGLQPSSASPREMTLPAGTRTGFLPSVAELLDRAVAAAAVRQAGTPEPPLRYVFGQRLYELRLRKTRLLTLGHAGRSVPAVHAAFEIHTLSTGTRTAFEITSGVDGDLAGVPLLIQWQPRWWLKVELHLV